MTRLAMIGPESSGKTTLAEDLTKSANRTMVSEYARTYLHDLGGHYTLEDVLHCAMKQFEANENSNHAEVVICDTELLNFKVWTEVRFGKCPEWIERHVLKQHFDGYLLCAPDLSWEPDPLRESPDQKERESLFKMYRELLEQYGYSYAIINGSGSDRMVSAEAAILNFLQA